MVLPSFAQGVGQMCPTMPGTRARRLGHPCSSCWSSVPVYMGTDTHVHGYELPCTWVKIFIGVRLLIVDLFCIAVESHVGVSMLLAPFQHVLLLFRHESCLS